MINSFNGKYRFLSNFYPCMVQYHSITYPSVEHAYQAQKTTVVSDQLWIASQRTARAAKIAGRQVGLHRADWDVVKVDIMRELLMFKFGHQELLEKLLETGDEELVEGNWWGDRFWGVCHGEGKNMLGKLLMEVRSKYQESLQSVIITQNIA